MSIYINVSNTFKTRSKTGIQRVVREVVSRLVKRQDVILITWYKTDFYQLSSVQEITNFLAAHPFEPQKKIKISELNKRDIFFDPDASWGDAYDIKQLYQLLKKQGVILTKLHHDAVPVLFPQYAQPHTVFSYTDNFTASLQYCDYWLCTTQTVRSDLSKISNTIDAGEPVTKVVPLGADFSQNGQQPNEELTHIEYGI